MGYIIISKYYSICPSYNYNYSQMVHDVINYLGPSADGTPPSNGIGCVYVAAPNG